MIRAPLVLVPALLLGQALAQDQKVDLKTATPKDQALRFSISTDMKLNVTSKTLVNGEEMAGRGGGRGGMGGETSVVQEIVFDQGPADANWREYKKLQATETRPGGPDAEVRESKVKGGLEGKKVFLKAAEDGVQLVEGEGDKAKPVAANLSRGVPGRVSLDGLVPMKPVAVGEEFDLSKTFQGALRGLVHPVTPERPQAAGEQGGGQGGRGGEQGGGQGGRGEGRAPGGGRMGGGGAGSTVIQLISGGKLDVKATGKVIAVEEKDGKKIAVVEVSAKLSGKGTGEQLGLPTPGAGGRAAGGGQGGQGGRGGQIPAPTSDKAEASFDLTGKVRVDLTSQLVSGLELGGTLTIARATSRTMDREGQEAKIDTTTDTKGKFQIKAACEPATR